MIRYIFELALQRTAQGQRSYLLAQVFLVRGSISPIIYIGHFNPYVYLNSNKKIKIKTCVKLFITITFCNLITIHALHLHIQIFKAYISLFCFTCSLVFTLPHDHRVFDMTRIEHYKKIETSFHTGRLHYVSSQIKQP